MLVKGRTGLTNRFTPDGRIVTSDQDGSLELRDPATLDVMTGVAGLERPVIAPSFTRDGQLMVTTDDLTAAVRLWRLDELEQFGGPIEGVVGGTIHPDGSALVLGGDPALRLPLDPDVWVSAACETAGRNLTREEWKRYFADEPYRRTCA